MRNSIGWRDVLASLQGSTIERDLRSYVEPLEEINRLEDDITRLSDHELTNRARRARDRVVGGTSLDDVGVEWFALARDASRRVLGLRPFDEQVVAALALHRGTIIEMQTGEGKTLAGVLPASLNALSGRGAHVLTFNDYLAQRDAEWMGPVYRMLGVSTAFIQQGMQPAERRQAYLADVTYVTAKEAGFDHLRDLLALGLEDIVHRAFHFALVDEADSLLIDEARVPLVIAGSVDRQAASPNQLSALVGSLVAGTHFDLDEYARDVELTEDGIEHLERTLGCGKLHDEANYRLLTEVNCALHARVLLQRDVDYIVRDGRIEIVDEFTGRVIRDRHWPEGLQAALEAKEGLQRQPDGRILGSITLQHFLRSYPRLCGMTGTAQDAAPELSELYGLDVVIVPTHRPMVRVDQPDVVFTHREAKEGALVAEIARCHASQRPVLVGTLTVEESERLAQRLREAGIACKVLNAKNDAMEARIVAGAGALGAVTIATNMAGRGTDIRLGGKDEATRDRVLSLGGLYVIGTNRHESRRIDLQLRGRAGRQGDPGETRFFISLDDDLLIRYGIADLIPARFIPERRSEPIDHPVVRREIARAQRIIEGQNFEIRKTLWRYASVCEDHRVAMMRRRQAILHRTETPHVWQQWGGRREALVAVAGEDAVRDAERVVTLFHIDRLWRDHLSSMADLREGIHLVRLGGHDPLTRFTSEANQAFDLINDAIDAAVLETLQRIELDRGGIDLESLGLKGPSSTWTYLVNDDPFRNQIAMMLTGPGRASVAMYAALFLSPLVIAWALADRFLRKRPSRRS